MNELLVPNSLKVEYQLPTLKYDITSIKDAVKDLEEEINELLKTATDDDIELIKSNKTELNKLAKALSDKRIEIVKEIKKPLDVFDKDVKDITKTVQDLSDKLNAIVIDYETEQKDKKRKEIMALSDYADYTVFNEKWLLKGTSIKQVEFDLSEQKKTFETNCKLIDATCKAYNLEPDKYFKMLVSADDVDSIIKMIENDNDVRNTYQDKPTEQATVKVSNEILRETDIYSKTFTVKATKAQLIMLKDYMDKIGIEIV